jgi:phosphatidylglycerol:prolipoprotein diacylglycerol transferase
MKFLALNPGFSIFGIHVAWYGVIMACSMAMAIILCIFLAKRRRLKGSDFVAPALWALPFAIIGARTMYVLFPPAGVQFNTFVEALQIWNGGMSIWGGGIGGALGLAIYCLIFKKDFLAYGDVIAPGLIFAQSIGRWGNFLNQEAYGWEVTNPTYLACLFQFLLKQKGLGTWQLFL